MGTKKPGMSGKMQMALKSLDMLLPVVQRVHGEAHPELAEVRTVYDALKEKLKAGEAAGELPRQLRAAAKDFAIPPDACPAFRKTYRTLSWVTDNLREKQVE